MLEASFALDIGAFSLRVRFNAAKGVLSVLGPSGSGKSLTLKCLAGLLHPDKGIIRLNDRTLFDDRARVNVPPHRRHIGFVFQNYALFPHMTVAENIGYGVRHLEKRVRIEKIADMLRRMRLEGLERRFPSQLSGGQQQRTALGRTLITAPDLLLLDEPFSALDGPTRLMLQRELIDIINDNFDGITLLVTHNLDEAYRIGSSIMIMENGAVIQSGDRDEVIRSPRSIGAARITGCSNIFTAEIVSEEDGFLVLKAEDLVLRAKRTTVGGQRRVMAGIREHRLRLVGPEERDENAYPCEIVEMTETLSSLSLSVRCCGVLFRVEADRRDIPPLRSGPEAPLRLRIPPEDVFLMGEAEQGNVVYSD